MRQEKEKAKKREVVNTRGIPDKDFQIIKEIIEAHRPTLDKLAKR